MSDDAMQGLEALGTFARRIGYVAGAYAPASVLYRWRHVYAHPMQVYPSESRYMGHDPRCECGMCPDVGPAGVDVATARRIDPTLRIRLPDGTWST